MEELFKKRYYLIFLSVLLGPLSTNSLIPIFKPLQTAFSLESIAFISVAISVYTLPFAILQLFAGTFSDIVDKKKVVIFGFFIFIIGMVLALISVYLLNYAIFLLGFLVQGIGFSFINPTVLAILGIITPERKSGLIMGLFNASAGLGVSLGAILSGFFSMIDYRILFSFNLITTLVSLVSFFFALRSCEALVCRTFELNPSTYQKSDVKESKFISTLVKLKKNLKPTIILLGFLGFFCFFTIITVSNALNEQIRISVSGLSEEEIISNVSLILMFNGIFSTLLSPVAGSLLKKHSPYILLTTGFILLSFIFLLPFGSSLVFFLILSLIIYVGSVFIWPALFKKAMDIDPDSRGTNSAIINSLRFFGYALVGPVYLLLGIPIIYVWVLVFNIIGLLVIMKLKKIS